MDFAHGCFKASISSYCTEHGALSVNPVDKLAALLSSSKVPCYGAWAVDHDLSAPVYYCMKDLIVTCPGINVSLFIVSLRCKSQTSGK